MHEEQVAGSLRKLNSCRQGHIGNKRLGLTHPSGLKVELEVTIANKHPEKCKENGGCELGMRNKWII